VTAAAVSQPATLQVDAVSKSYGGLRAVADVALWAKPDEVLGITGPNGAGKTTLFDVISGLTRPSRGDVLLDDRSIAHASVHRRCHLGLARTFQQPVVAESLTVHDNVMLGAHYGRAREHWSGVDGTPGTHAEWVLALTGLTDKAGLVAGPLGVFDKKRVMLASALATGPRVLLLDEPFGGLTPQEIDATLELLRVIHKLGVTVVCIDHVMRALVRLATQVVVMHHGAVFFEGTPREMMRDKSVIEIYLGRSSTSGERDGQ
jgi:branched-chain amino acid transport system ATP-binding protein